MILFVIFGTQGSTRTLASGRFFCPECQGERSYKRQSVRQNVSLFFVPVIPLAERGQYIECQSCGGTFREAVLDYRPGPSSEEIQANFRNAVKMTMALMMISDGKLDSEEEKTIRDIYEKVTDKILSPSDVRALAAKAKNDRRGFLEYLEEVGTYLNDSGKELVVKAAFFVAAADQEFHEEEQKLMGEIGNALEMSPAHVRGVIAELMAPSVQ